MISLEALPMTETLKYAALRVQQTPESAPFYLLSCQAESILKWCDVPRKKESFMAGYQRELGERHEKISEFFKADPKNNLIPNAVIIATRADSVKLTPTDLPDFFECEILMRSKPFPEMLRDMVAGLRSRLSADEIASISIPTTTSSEGQDDGDAVEESVPPDSYLATIVKQLESADGHLDELEKPTRDAITEYVNGVSKPGLIIDGQHRVFGAKNVSDFPINLPVVLLPGLDYREQVFHFYVLNNKAKPLSKTELRTIVSTSLSKREIGELYDRFRQVGVTAEQTEWTYQMNVADESPFKGLVNFSLDGSRGVIPENVAHQVVSRFMNSKSKHKLLYKNVPEWNSSTDPDKWAYRIKLFFAFWRAVKNKYPDAWNKAATETNTQILQKVSLLNLQDYLLDALNGEMPRRSAKKEPSPFASSDTLEEEVGYQLEYLNEEFFLKEWKEKGLDTSRGHELFKASISQAVANQSSNLGNMRLFKGTT
jgi:DGQHR domain-containing protein